MIQLQILCLLLSWTWSQTFYFPIIQTRIEAEDSCMVKECAANSVQGANACRKSAWKVQLPRKVQLWPISQHFLVLKIFVVWLFFCRSVPWQWRVNDFWNCKQLFWNIKVSSNPGSNITQPYRRYFCFNHQSSKTAFLKCWLGFTKQDPLFYNIQLCTPG